MEVYSSQEGRGGYPLLGKHPNQILLTVNGYHLSARTNRVSEVSSGRKTKSS
jgi:hypothetical protein